MTVTKHGKDKGLEAQANEWLNKGAGKNKRSVDRDIEKRKYELGIIAREDLQHYDPDNDFDAKDSVFSLLVDGDIDYIEPTLCGDVDDVNTRKRSRENPSLPDGVWGRAGEEERNGLSTPVDDDARPVFAKGREKAATTFLGAYEVGARKTCKGPCGRSKGLECFSPKADAADGRHPVCKACRKEIVSQNRKNARSGA
ncbi:hypothetical protein K883_05122 [Mycobacterium sp. TKK-01-0059]|nr:hypothetical protein K883_05122 [Mycobacterium sp. TKK-01-0059]